MSDLKGKFSSQIQESAESKAERLRETFNSNNLKSLEFPKQDEDGYVIGKFTAFDLIEPTGEVKRKKDGETFVSKNNQLKFTFTVESESGGTTDLYMWTGTCVDGVKDDLGQFSKLTTWLVAIGAIDPKILHPKFKADEKSLMTIIQDAFEGRFRFKAIQDGRIYKPLINTFQFVPEKE